MKLPYVLELFLDFLTEALATCMLRCSGPLVGAKSNILCSFMVIRVGRNIVLEMSHSRLSFHDFNVLVSASFGLILEDLLRIGFKEAWE